MEFFKVIYDGFLFIIEFIYSGIYEFVEEVMQELVAWMVIAKLQGMLFMMEFSWGVAKQIMINLNIGDYIQTGFNGLDPVLMGYLNFFRVPESINLIVQAIATRVTLKVMGWQ
jgi:hypothetical protein